MEEKIKKPTKAQYENAKLDLLQSFCPTIYTCCHCGWPVVDGWCCRYCGSESPGRGEEE